MLFCRVRNQRQNLCSGWLTAWPTVLLVRSENCLFLGYTQPGKKPPGMANVKATLSLRVFLKETWGCLRFHGGSWCSPFTLSLLGHRFTSPILLTTPSYWISIVLWTLSFLSIDGVSLTWSLLMMSQTGLWTEGISETTVQLREWCPGFRSPDT